MDWMLMPLRRYAEFSGRSRRMEYWMFALLNFIVIAVLMAIKFGTGDVMAELGALDSSNPMAVYGWMFGGTGMLLALWWLATLIPNIAVNVRRLHDRDMSGWWYLGFVIASFIPFINLLAGLGYLVLMFLEGTRGPNRFGPDPKDPTNTAVFE